MSTTEYIIYRCPQGRIGNQVEILDGPTTVIRCWGCTRPLR